MQPPATNRVRVLVLGTPIDVLDWPQAVERLSTWANLGESRYVCVCNVHSLVTASKMADFRNAIWRADMATADGMPVAWRLRWAGHKRQPRINGPDLMWRCLEHCERTGQSIFFYGGSPSTLAKLAQRVRAEFPRLRIAGSLSPPYADPGEWADQDDVDRINASGASWVFVGLGCPKQELWMAAHQGRVHAVMIGVGAAFDFHAGTLPRAPLWMQRSGLEWLHRLLREPRRLWRRYLMTNTMFLVGTARELARGESGQRFPFEH